MYTWDDSQQFESSDKIRQAWCYFLAPWTFHYISMNIESILSVLLKEYYSKRTDVFWRWNVPLIKEFLWIHGDLISRKGRFQNFINFTVFGKEETSQSEKKIFNDNIFDTFTKIRCSKYGNGWLFSKGNFQNDKRIWSIT